MRNLEMLLLPADLVTLAIMAFPRLHDAGWWRLSTIAAVAIAFAQVGVEGPRWQLVPAFALTLMFFLASIARRSTAVADAARRVRLRRIAIGCAAVGLAVAAALPMIVPVFQFPLPTGPYAIGTLTYHWVDTTRPEAFVADPHARRELMVQIWYPAQAQASGPRAAYLPDAGAVMSAFARIQDKPVFIFGHLKYVMTHAMASAPAASDLPAFPVLLWRPSSFRMGIRSPGSTARSSRPPCGRAICRPHRVRRGTRRPCRRAWHARAAASSRTSRRTSSSRCVSRACGSPATSPA
jgi:hypothetical protein